ncbi:Protein of unknown function (DUF4050) [Teratosphaeria destructans]|uniref:Gag1-like clamp domain-containing protein n=1 Tax=Teratosphaeria destructans TaxID=418781 RepID=A0A9W7SQW9_9PEZI|nr:Protein of unknown function (DUF4050) [Teratosphaeria destructans]
MTLLGHGHGHKSAEQQQEVREARRVLKEKIRDDWEYPPLPEWQAHSSGRRRGKARMGDDEERVAGFRFHAPPGRDGPECAAAMSWREREYSSESEAGGEGNPVSATSAGSKASSKFRFEGPDSVGTEISQRRLARRRTRQRDLETEMTWNPGLAHWVRQRDVWSGATTTTTTNHVQIAHGNEVERPETASGASTPCTSSSHSDPASSPPTSRSSAATTPDPAPSSLPPIHPTTAPPLIPIASPILPNHPIRRRITPAMYTEIYTKIIVQGRTPSVPINLLTLISALVEGWKADGEWPPKTSGPPEPSLARRKVGRRAEEGVVKMGVKAVGKVLRLGHGHGEGG